MKQQPRSPAVRFPFPPLVAPLLAAASLALLPLPGSAAPHPSTVFTDAELARLRAARTDPAYAELLAALRATVDPQVGKPLTSAAVFGDVRLAGYALAGYALAAEIQDVPAWRDLARTSLLNALKWTDWGFGEGDDLNRAHLLLGATIAWDVLHPHLSATDRTNVRNRLAAEAARFAAAVDRNAWWVTDYVQNHNWINFAALGLAGLALEGEDSRAASWVSRARENDRRIKAVFDLVTDGSWHEGVGYQQYGMGTALPWWIAAARRGFGPGDNAMTRALGTYLFHVQLPNNGRGYIATHGDWTGWTGPVMAQNLRWTARRFGDRRAQEAARRWASAGPRSTAAWNAFHYAMEAVALDPSVPGADLTAQPLDFYGDDQQLAILRSNWGRGALVVALKNGVLGGRGNYERIKDGAFPGGILNIGHDHMDDLGLWIYGDGEWLMPECVGYNIGRTTGPKAWQTAFHNSLLIGGRGQLGDEREGVHSATAHAWFFQRDAHVPLTASTLNYAFARGDGTKLYPASLKPTGIFRTVALARDGYAVLRDTVALGAAQNVEQVFHFMDAAAQEGGWIRGDAKNGRRLGIGVVSPAAFATTFSTQTADKLTKGFEADNAVSLVRVRASAATTAATFLELLWPARLENWNARPVLTALDRTRPHVGLHIAFPGGRTEEWIFNAGARTEASGLVLEGDTGIRRTAADGTLERAVLLGRGRLYDESGTRLLVGTESAGVLEVTFAGNRAHLSGTAAQDARFWGPSVEALTVNGAAAPWRREGEMVIVGQAPLAPLVPPPPLYSDDGDVLPAELDADGGLPDSTPRGSGGFGPDGAPGETGKKSGCACTPAGSTGALALLLFAGWRRRRPGGRFPA